MTTVVDDKVGELERENAELRRRLAEREAELAEALGRETANVEILQVINPLPGDLEPVFDAILDKALDLCGASFGHLLSWDGEYLNRAAARGASPDEAFLQRYTPIPGSAGDRLLRGENVIRATDLRQERPIALARQVLGCSWTVVALGAMPPSRCERMERCWVVSRSIAPTFTRSPTNRWCSFRASRSRR
jgi:hypothetical protein